MTGTTHAMVGATTAVIFAQPQNTDQLVFCVAAGALGGLATDIDVKQSKGAKGFRAVMAVLAVTAILTLVGYNYGHYYLINVIKSFYVKHTIAMCAFLVLLGIGYHTPHRQYTHSIEWMLAETLCLMIVNHTFAILFMVGYAMHIALDLLNKKRVRLSIIFNFKFCLNWVPASGTVNTICSFIAVIGLLAYYKIALLGTTTNVIIGMIQ